MLLIGLASACAARPPAAPSATPAAGIAIALYQQGEDSFAVVDDRRLLDVRDGAVVIDRLDPGVALPTLVIEPLGGAPLAIGACTRGAVLPSERDRDRGGLVERDAEEPAPATGASTVRCTVRGSVGPHLVRVLYVSRTLGYRAEHAITMTRADLARVTTRYAIATPSWGGRADVTLYDGAPGGERAPVAVSRGSIVLDGTTATLTAPARDVRARLRRIYDGERNFGGDVESEESAAQAAVWVWLELALTQLAPGTVRAAIDVPGEGAHEVEVPADGREQGARWLRLAVWADPALRGARIRRQVGRADVDLAEWFALTITNVSDEPREVWLEQRLHAARRRSVLAAEPAAPVLGGDRARSKVLLGPRQQRRVTYTITYAL